MDFAPIIPVRTLYSPNNPHCGGGPLRPPRIQTLPFDRFSLMWGLRIQFFKIQDRWHEALSPRPNSSQGQAMSAKSARSARHVETRKKKAKRKIPRKKVTRNQGNTKAVRIQLKKEAGYARAAEKPADVAGDAA